ncbi:MAG: cupin domain-containing protein [Pseudobdellovibrio sp.]
MEDIIKVGQLGVRYFKDAAKEKQMGAFELIVPPKANVPPAHSHSQNEEMVYVIEGVLRYSVDGVSRDLKVGDSMFTPKNSVHGFSNPFDQTAKAIVVLSPDVGAQYFRDVAEIVNTGGPPDKAKLVAVMEKYGLKIAAPPVSA